jgi:hypothetical protein
MLNFHQAIELNNEGTSLLAGGEEELAITIFKSALALMKSGICGHHIEEDAHETSLDTSSESVLHVSPVTFPCPALVEDYFIYSHALRVRSSGCSQKDMDFLSSVIIFNMALLYNIRGIRANSSSLQNRGLQLYGMSLGLMENLASKCLDSILLRVVCLNNMSQITFNQGDFEKARLMLNHLQYLMSRNPRTNVFDENEVQGFMLNVMLMHPPTAAQAA